MAIGISCQTYRSKRAMQHEVMRFERDHLVLVEAGTKAIGLESVREGLLVEVRHHMERRGGVALCCC